MLVGIKPTVGRISRYGVIPITADQDTAGPMAKSVTDAAIMLGALESAAPDPNDPATKRALRRPGATTRSSSSRRPEGRAHRHSPRASSTTFDSPAAVRQPGGTRRRIGDGLNPEQAQVMDEAIADPESSKAR